MLRMLDGEVKGFFAVGREPGGGLGQLEAPPAGDGEARLAGGPRPGEIETAAFWQDSPEIETGELVPEEIATEVFFLPAAAHTEKDGCFTNTQRLLQWRHKAIEPPGDCRSELHFFYHLGRKIREKLAGSTDAAGPPDARPDLGLPARSVRTRSPSAEAVLREINGRELEAASSSPATTSCRPTADRLRLMDPRRHLRGRREPARPPQATRRAELGGLRVGLGVAGEHAHPLQPRLRGPGREAVVGAQALRLVGRGAGPVDRPRRARLQARQAARLRARRRTPRGSTALPGSEPFIVQPDGLGWLFAPTGLVDGPMPTHYEPHESPFDEPALRPAAQTRPPALRPPGEPYNPTAASRHRGVPVRADELPAHRAPHGRRDVAHGRRTCRSSSPSCSARCQPGAGRRARPRARRVGHDRHRPHGDRGARDGHRPREAAARRGPRRPPGGLPYHWGGHGLVTGDAANDLFSLALDPNVHIQESKAATVTSARAAGRAARRCWSWSRSTGDGRDRGSRSQSEAVTALAERPVAVELRGEASRGWASSPTPRSASAARRARWPARSGTRCRTIARASRQLVRQHASTLGADTWRHVAFVEQRKPLGAEAAAESLVEAAERSQLAERTASQTYQDGDGVRWLMSSDVCKHCTARRLPRRLPDRGAVPHRVRHRRRAGGRLQRLRLLRAGLPVRRDRPARGRRPRLEVHALLRPAQGRPGAGLRAGLPDRLDPVRRARRAARAAPSAARALARGGRSRGSALRRRRRTTAWAGSAPSSCCSTSRRPTGCRRTRWSRRATSARSGRARWRGGAALGAGIAAAVLGGAVSPRGAARWSTRGRAAVLLRAAGDQAAGMDVGDPAVLLHRRHGRRVRRRSRWPPSARATRAGPPRVGVALAGVGVSPLLLVSDLGRRRASSTCCACSRSPRR